MLFHLRFPGARGIILSGDFNGWKTSVSDGGIALQKLSDSEWAVVVPEHILLPRVNPYQFKFIVETDSGKIWLNGMYHRVRTSPHNSLIYLTGKETYCNKEKARMVLEVMYYSFAVEKKESAWYGVDRQRKMLEMALEQRR